MINRSQQVPFISFHRHMENFAYLQGGLPQTHQSAVLTVRVLLMSFIMKTNKQDIPGSCLCMCVFQR